MQYISQSLVFEEDRIYFLGKEGEEREVMMDWEDELMSASAAYITQNGGDILEIGFGMGISAGYIQSHSISSHTIIENHPEIIPLALNWASDKPNVIIVTGSWYSNLNNLSTWKSTITKNIDGKLKDKNKIRKVINDSPFVLSNVVNQFYKLYEL